MVHPAHLESDRQLGLSHLAHQARVQGAELVQVARGWSNVAPPALFDTTEAWHGDGPVRRIRGECRAAAPRPSSGCVELASRSRRRPPEHHGRPLRRCSAAAEFKTDMSFATYGQNMSAAVTADEAGTTVVIEGIAKRQSVAGRDSARIRKIASEILSDLEARLFQAALVDPEPLPAPARTAARSRSVRRSRSSRCCTLAASSRPTSSRTTSAVC